MLIASWLVLKAGGVAITMPVLRERELVYMIGMSVLRRRTTTWPKTSTRHRTAHRPRTHPAFWGRP